MNNNELWERLILEMEQNTEYQQALQGLKAVEADYVALLEALPAQQRKILDQYIAACEEMDEALVFAAYRLGLLDGRLQ